MAGQARVEFSGALYHVLDRGDRGEPIFQDDEDRRRFRATLAEVCLRTGWRVHAWMLLTNHSHFWLGNAAAEPGAREALVGDRLDDAFQCAASPSAGELRGGPLEGRGPPRLQG